MNLVYIHNSNPSLNESNSIPNPVPDYFVDSVFQALLINKTTKFTLYILVNKSQIKVLEKNLQCIDWELYKLDYHSHVKIIPIESIVTENEIDIPISDELVQFRGGFWKHTITRFYILANFIQMYKLRNVFHIENDVMVFRPFETIYLEYFELVSKTKILVVKDSPNRVVPSIVFFPSVKSATLLVKHIKESIEKSTTFKNDMNILGSYKNIVSFNILPETSFNRDKIPMSRVIFDGAAIGQYLGGTDPRNSGASLDNFEECLDIYRKTSGFINETSVFKPNTCNYMRKSVHITPKDNPINIFVAIKSGELFSIANIHVHSKNLKMFSSVNSIEFDDIISGDRVLDLVDFIITTRDIYQFHQNHNVSFDKFVIFNDFSKFNVPGFHSMLREKEKSNIKLFIYTHILIYFQEYILPILPSDITFTLYTGNSDHEFNNDYLPLINSPKIHHIYAQNLNILSEKCSILPIGQANAMWVHGNRVALYKNILNSCTRKKSKTIHVNINTKTFPYRQVILDACIKNGLDVITEPKPFDEYLRELSTYMFCLSPRGNGIDVHRTSESLYLGVIPILIDNEHTNLHNHIINMKALDVPFVVVNDLSELIPENFTYERYKKLIRESGYIGNSKFLKLSSYK